MSAIIDIHKSLFDGKPDTSGVTKLPRGVQQRGLMAPPVNTAAIPTTTPRAAPAPKPAPTAPAPEPTPTPALKPIFHTEDKDDAASFHARFSAYGGAPRSYAQQSADHAAREAKASKAAPAAPPAAAPPPPATPPPAAQKPVPTTGKVRDPRIIKVAPVTKMAAQSMSQQEFINAVHKSHDALGIERAPEHMIKAYHRATVDRGSMANVGLMTPENRKMYPDLARKRNADPTWDGGKKRVPPSPPRPEEMSKDNYISRTREWHKQIVAEHGPGYFDKTGIPPEGDSDARLAREHRDSAYSNAQRTKTMPDHAVTDYPAIAAMHGLGPSKDSPEYATHVRRARNQQVQELKGVAESHGFTYTHTVKGKDSAEHHFDGGIYNRSPQGADGSLHSNIGKTSLQRGYMRGQHEDLPISPEERKTVINRTAVPFDDVIDPSKQHRLVFNEKVS